jgi:Domain of unknown function (DUF4160)
MTIRRPMSTSSDPGWLVVIDLIGPNVREAINCSEHEARRVLRLIENHQAELMDAWRRFHD